MKNNIIVMLVIILGLSGCNSRKDEKAIKAVWKPDTNTPSMSTLQFK